MRLDEFFTKWSKANLKERSAAQEHFIDLCHLLGHPTPAEADAEGSSFTFEKGAKKAAAGEGFADVPRQANQILPSACPCAASVDLLLSNQD